MQRFMAYLMATALTLGLVGVQQAATSEAATTSGSTGAELSWAPPPLTAPITIKVGATGGSWKLDDTKDYVVEMPSQPVMGFVNLHGGRNIHLIGGEIVMPSYKVQALKLEQFTGTLHVEGLRIDPGGSKGYENDAIRVNSKHASSVAVFQNIWVDKVTGTYASSHGDVMQSWGGPATLRVDRLSGSTDYQGFFLATEHFSWAPQGKELTFRNIDLHGLDPGPGSLYSISNQGSAPLGDPPPATVHNVWGRVSGRKAGVFPKWHANTRMGGVIGTVNGVRDGWANGTASESHFVDRTAVGIGYTSPGYVTGGVVPTPTAPAPTTTVPAPTTTVPAPTTTVPAPTATADAPRLLVSSYANRPYASDLEGRTVSGSVHVFTDDSDVREVAFWLDDPTGSKAPMRVDTAAPFDLVGGTTWSATPLDTSTMTNGTHTVRARATHGDGTTSLSLTTFTVAGGVTGAAAPTTTTTAPTPTTTIAPPTTTTTVAAAAPTTTVPATAPSDVEIRVSYWANRPHARDLDGLVTDRSLYVFTTGSSLKKVEYWLDDPNAVRSPMTTDTAAPFDLVGGTTYRAEPLAISTLSNGKHSVRVVATHQDGTKVVQRATFTVAK